MLNTFANFLITAV